MQNIPPNQPQKMPLLCRLTDRLGFTIERCGVDSEEANRFITEHANDHPDFLEIAALMQKCARNPRMSAKTDEHENALMEQIGDMLRDCFTGDQWKIDQFLLDADDEFIRDMVVIQRYLVDSFLAEDIVPWWLKQERDEDSADWWKKGHTGDQE